MSNKKTFREAGYVSCKSLGNGEFLLIDELGNKELWLSKKNSSDNGIRYKNTHLTFVKTVSTEYEDKAQQLWDDQNIFERD